jgi:hypothetical protein
VAFLATALVAGLLWWLWDPRRGPRRAALRELRLIRESAADAASLARSIESVLRRYALAVFGPERVASLTGQAWLGLVASEGGEPLAGAPGRSLLAAAFGGDISDDREQWLAGAESFLRRAPRRRTLGRR